MSQAEEILAVEDLTREPAKLPEWGKAGSGLYVKMLSGDERHDWAVSWNEYRDRGRENQKHYAAFLVARCLVTESGERVFSDAQVAKLASKSGRVIARLFAQADRLNLITDTSIEEAAKNSESGQSQTKSGDSGTSSLASGSTATSAKSDDGSAAGGSAS